jgi:hypothetical protein
MQQEGLDQGGSMVPGLLDAVIGWNDEIAAAFRSRPQRAGSPLAPAGSPAREGALSADRPVAAGSRRLR